MTSNLTSSFYTHNAHPRNPTSFPTRRSSDLDRARRARPGLPQGRHPRSGRGGLQETGKKPAGAGGTRPPAGFFPVSRSEEHTSELQSRFDFVCRLLLEKKNKPDAKLNSA